MIVYHGSNMIVDQPRLVHQNRTLDFGYGFYTTTNQNQAVNFAGKGGNKHNQCAFGKMEICNQGIHCLKMITGINKNVGPCRFFRKRTVFFCK